MHISHNTQYIHTHNIYIYSYIISNHEVFYIKFLILTYLNLSFFFPQTNIRPLRVPPWWACSWAWLRALFWCWACSSWQRGPAAGAAGQNRTTRPPSRFPAERKVTTDILSTVHWQNRRIYTYDILFWHSTNILFNNKFTLLMKLRNTSECFQTIRLFNKNRK